MVEASVTPYSKTQSFWVSHFLYQEKQGQEQLMSSTALVCFCPLAITTKRNPITHVDLYYKMLEADEPVQLPNSFQSLACKEHIGRRLLECEG